MTKSDDKRVPALRFKGFTDEWEQRKLENITKRISRKNLNLDSTLPLTISAQYGLVDQRKFFDKQIASKKLENYLLLKNGEFAYNKSYSKDYPFGAIKRLNNYKLGVLSTLYIAFKPVSINTDYLEEYFDSTKWYKEIYKRATEGARNYGLLNISPQDFFELNLSIPNNRIEQERISEILKLLSLLITLQQRKLKDYSLIKKKLSNIFFNDTIVKQNNFLFKHRVKASQLFISFSKKGFVHLPVLSASQDKGMIFREDESKNILYAHNNLTNYKLVEPDDFVVHLRSFQGGFAYSDKTGIASPAYTIFKFKDDVDYNPVYWKEKFKSYNFIQLLKKVTYGVRDGRSISFSDFLSLYLTFPDIEIQNKIGSALSKLDTQISDQKKIIKKLENVKQFLLQNMFV